ncbi:hypothetical protein EB796_014620 [Bugula neritina]|uniref:Caspase family p20 domain-containing protein n=1 Tax=Bugula neritina TaxID=10212 RepID=A0A7J7JNS5_BUGNE|nr:hypothetical protein EB796_014620 [Bugula neritina]
MQVLSVKTSGGDTPILTLARFGRYNALKEVFQQLEQLDSDVLMSYLLECNDNNQNILHLIALSPTLEDLSLLLKDFFCSSDIIDMMYPDIYGNTPIHYVAAKYATKTFADFMLNLPLAIRKSIADASNVQLTDCRRIIYKKSFNELFYVQKVLCDESNKQLTSKFNNVKALFAEDLEQQLAAPENAFKYDEDILRVLKYSLNEYSLLDSAYKTSNFLFSSAFNSQRVTVLSNEAYRSRKLLEPTKAQDHVFIAIDTGNVGEPKQMKIQNTLNDMDIPRYNGKPKIAVIQNSLSEADLNLIPPGPDYLILLVKYNTDKHASNKQVPNVEKCDSIHSMIAELSSDPDVQKVSVNSTLNKRYIREKDEWLADDDKVEKKYDMSANEMLSSISEFSRSEGHGSMAVLAIFSHGKDGMVYGNDGESNCSVQEIVNHFNIGHVKDIPKIVFLSCCRGDISAIYNRAPHSFESSDKFPDIPLLYKPIKRELPPIVKTKEWERQATNCNLPLDIPVDCYVCFTTLPDSRSKAGMFFKYFSEYLSELTNCMTSDPHTSNKTVRDTTSRDSFQRQKQSLEVSVEPPVSKPTVQKVELVDLLTDVAGVLREKFQSKQCFNLCYSVNRDSKHVVLDLAPLNLCN